VIVATGIASIAVFFGAFWRVGVARIAGDVLATTQLTAAAMRDEDLDDQSREQAVQRATLRLLSQLGSILIRSAAAIGAAITPVFLAHVAGLASADRVFAFLSRWETGVATTAVAAAAYGIRAQMWRTN
jgi:hypothetical protein